LIGLGESEFHERRRHNLLAWIWLADLVGLLAALNAA